MNLSGLSRSSVVSTNCLPVLLCFRTRNVYVLLVFRRRLSVGVYVLVVFHRRLSVGSTNCSSYSFLCFKNEECLCISCFLPALFLERGMFMYYSFFAGVYRSVRLTALAIPFCVLERGVFMY